MLDELEEDANPALPGSPGSPRHPGFSSRNFDARIPGGLSPQRLSPTVRNPKARRNILVDTDAEVNEHLAPAFGRGSPNPFHPIRDRSGAGSAGADDEAYSMAGLTNVQELRRAAQVHRGYDPEPMIKACVKVFVTQVQPSYAMPWARGEEARSTGSGFVVTMPPEIDMADDPTGELHEAASAAAPGCRCIVTNAHVVENFSLIQVRGAGSADKYVARVLCIGHDVDLAILLVHDEAFWEGLALVTLGAKLPRLASEVFAVGFPVGGDDVSATRGVVSRILVGGLTDNLCVQIDAAINPGNRCVLSPHPTVSANISPYLPPGCPFDAAPSTRPIHSGGPVFDSSGKVVGVAFSGLMNANNVGYIIPLPVVHTFLQNFRRHGEYTGKCSDCFEIQSMENVALRRSFGLNKESVRQPHGLLQPVAPAAAYPTACFSPLLPQPPTPRPASAVAPAAAYPTACFSPHSCSHLSECSRLHHSPSCSRRRTPTAHRPPLTSRACRA